MNTRIRSFKKMPDDMRLNMLGDNTLLVRFEEEISPEINDKVRSLQNYLSEKYGDDVLYFIPSYSSLAIGFKEEIIKQESVLDDIKNFKNSEELESKATRKRYVPVCYHKSFGLDLEELSKIKQVDRQQIIDWHSSESYRVYMIGFLPGFPYMGKLKSELKTPRRKNIRKIIEKGSVAIASDQTGIYPQASPGAWHIIGRTPIDIFELSSSTKTFFQMGDAVQFIEIGLSEYYEIESMILDRSFDIEIWANDHI